MDVVHSILNALLKVGSCGVLVMVAWYIWVLAAERRRALIPRTDISPTAYLGG
ncbi:MAG: hypothetical protein GY911_11885 [Actinomycetales bacterium]|nr:hypothetical protein [Actinomycetales bacterium]